MSGKAAHHVADKPHMSGKGAHHVADKPHMSGKGAHHVAGKPHMSGKKLVSGPPWIHSWYKSRSPLSKGIVPFGGPMGTLRSRELCQATGATPRGVRFYMERGLLPKPEGRGTGPIYTEEHLIRLRAIRLLRAQRVPVDAIRVRLSRMSRDEIIALGTPPAPPAAPGPSAPLAASQGDATTAAAPAEQAWSVDRPRSADLWERIPLLPGLELHVRAGAGPLVQRLAAEIHARYCAGGAGPTTG